ncbi:MAG: hypothetical protein WD512_10095, partial [Candidatus Paceibacterota bacterium]
LFLALVGIGVVGCKKEVSSNDTSSDTPELITPDFRANKNLIEFNSIESYENFINNYEEAQKNEAFDALRNSNFQNYFSKTENHVMLKNDDGTDSEVYEMDDRFGQLLNVDGAIKIGDYLFKINLSEKEVRVVSYSAEDDYQSVLSVINSSSKEVKVFSTDDDVLEILETGTQEKCGGSSGFNKYEDVNDQYGGKFTFRARYFKAGIYNHVYVRGEHHYAGSAYNSQFYEDDMKFEVHVDEWWKALRVRRKPCGNGHATYHHGSVRNFTSWPNPNISDPITRIFHVYEQTRVLNGYRVWVRGIVKIQGTTYTTPYFGRIINSNF